MGSGIEVFYWRERGREVDFVLRAGQVVTGLEVKSGQRREHLPGMEAFARAFEPQRILLVGGQGVSLEEFLGAPVQCWLG